MLIDTHAHLDFECYENKFDEILSNAYKNDVQKFIIPAVTPKDYGKLLNIAQLHDNIFAAVGLHPSETEFFNNELCDKLKEFAKLKKVVAIGECGLDYYWDKTSIDEQKEAFTFQIKLANETEKTLIVHDRDAHFDTITILRKYREKTTPVIMHCFSGSVEFAQECLNEGFYIALGGVVTFKNAKKVHEVAKIIPLDRLLVETDCPFLTPEPFRGKENQPAYVRYVAEKIAELKEVDYSVIAENTTKNAEKILGI